jgi:hypothetical protein
MKGKYLAFLVLSLLLSFFILLSGYTTSTEIYAQGNSNTCPQDGGWTKIDSGDLSQYPVAGATAYCFKAGNFLTNKIPDGGFGQEGGCSEQNIQNCGLSHWSYYLSEVPVVNPFVRVTYICKAETDGSPEGYEVEMVSGEHLWRIRHEAGPSTDFSTNFLSEVQGYIQQGQTLLFATTQAANGVKVITTPLENQYGGTASVSGAICNIKEIVEEPDWTLTKTVGDQCVVIEDETYAQAIYSIVIKNDGKGDGKISSIMDELDSKVLEAYINSISDSGEYDSGKIIWKFEPGLEVVSGGSKEFTYTILIPEEAYGTYENTAIAYSGSVENGDIEVLRVEEILLEFPKEVARDSVTVDLECEIDEEPDEDGEVEGITDEVEEVKGTTTVVMAETGASDNILVYIVQTILMLSTLISGTLFVKKYII